MNNRIIKFRAWDKEQNCMLDWKYLNSIGYGPNKLIDKEIDDNMFNDPDFEMMQFTGFKDLHGVEIYEGDICLYLEHRDGKFTSIKWEDGAWQCGLFTLGKCVSPKNDMICNEIEVIGNIFQNKELLEENEQ